MKRAVVIGMGDISGIHIQAILNHPNIKLVAVCDKDKEKKAAAPAGVAFYTDYIEMIQREQPDTAHICLPHYLHVPISKEVASMGVHVFCEKPVALDTNQALEFAEFEERNPKIHIGVCLQNRLNESVEELKRIIDSKQYGAVTGTRGSVFWARPKEYYETKPWRGSWAQAGGGCMINQSVHTLDLLYYLGGPVKSIRASVSKLLDYQIEVEDSVIANLTYESGARGLFVATIANYKNENIQLAVDLEHAQFVIEDNILYEITSEGQKIKRIEDRKLPGSKFYYGASHAKMIAQFYEALETDTQNYLHVKDAVMSIRLIDAIQESGRHNSATIII